MGVAGLFSSTNKDGIWKFKGYSMTSVSRVIVCFVDSCIVISFKNSFVKSQHYLFRVV